MQDEQLIKYIANELSESERSDVESWIAASENHRKEFHLLKQSWEESAESDTFSVPDINEQWALLEPKLAEEKKSPVQWLWYAAAVVLLGIGFWFVQPPVEKTLWVARGETKTLRLADETEVTVNSESSLQYFTSTDGAERRVVLKGEAFFKVSKNGKPFIVETPNAEVKVLGTRFNVNTRAHQTKLYVDEGKVSFKNKTKSDEVILTEGFRSEVVSNHVPKPPVRDLQEVAWVNGKLAFENETLQDISTELERTLNIKIEIGTRISKRKLTATFQRNHTPESILNSIAISMDLVLMKIDNDTFKLNVK